MGGSDGKMNTKKGNFEVELLDYGVLTCWDDVEVASKLRFLSVQIEQTRTDLKK